MSDLEIENEIVEKGLTAPRVTPALIDSKIKHIYYFTAWEGVEGGDTEPEFKHDSLKYLTFCTLVLENGFTVTGESACASPENFDVNIGRKIAFNNAKEKIWALEGYLLKSKLSGTM